MIHEMNSSAIELTETELDSVAGGVIFIGDAKGYGQIAFNDFFQKNTMVAQQTFSGPDGSGTQSATTISETKSSAGQGIFIG